MIQYFQWVLKHTALLTQAPTRWYEGTEERCLDLAQVIHEIVREQHRRISEGPQPHSHNRCQWENQFFTEISPYLYQTLSGWPDYNVFARESKIPHILRTLLTMGSSPFAWDKSFPLLLVSPTIRLSVTMYLDAMRETHPDGGDVLEQTMAHWKLSDVST